MNTKQPQDERVVAQRQKINNEAYGILMVGLLISILVQQFYLKAPFSQYAVECLCFFGVSFYIVIRQFTLGLNLYQDEKKGTRTMLTTCLVIGSTVTIINGIMNYTANAEHYQQNGILPFITTIAITFITATGASSLMMMLFYYINKKKQASIQKQLDANE